ncbi:MAG: hypothetical protein CMG71_01130 [Candidatus Marinimicrobia bacterium]|nr:hypothetical protein [Candidatus Neomarinimicrobiota bacterium]
MNKTAVITTTINVPKFLDGISENAIKNKHSNISFYIIGDKKTPNEAVEYCKSLTKKFPYVYLYYDIDQQEKRLSKYPDLLKIIPYNSGVRKLLGNFIAVLDGADTVIQIDDDNFVTSDDLIGCHNVVGSSVDIDLYHSENGWYNVYTPLIEKNNIPFFPRGYPWSKRDYDNQYKIEKITKSARVVLINGLVYEDPDIDAISRLFWPIRVTGIKPGFNRSFGLNPGTWCSFNNQNTSTSSELTQVFFTPPSAGRNSDIWTSYVICKLVEHFSDVVAFGKPFVNQIRNVHDLWNDLQDELLNNIATDRFISLLRSINLTEKSYNKALNELIKKCLIQLNKSKYEIPDRQFEMIKQYFIEYDVWSKYFLQKSN